MWRGPGYQGPAAPEPWASRVEAFLSACAMHAGQRERDVMDIVEGFGEGLREAAAKKR